MKLLKLVQGVFSHSDGYKATMIFRKYVAQMRAAGMSTLDLNKMNNAELVKLKRCPRYILSCLNPFEDILTTCRTLSISWKSFDREVPRYSGALGDFSNITSMIVDSLTDSSIDDGLTELTNNINGAITKMVKDMLARQLLVGPIQKLTEDLFNSMDKGDGKYELDVNAAKMFSEGVKNLGGHAI